MLYAGLSFLFIRLNISEVEAKHSEVLKDTEATISCVVSGLTQKLDTVAWQKPNGDAIENNKDDFKIVDGAYEEASHSQTTVLTIPKTANTADSVYSCVITSNEHKKTAEKTSVNSNVFSEYKSQFNKIGIHSFLN